MNFDVGGGFPAISNGVNSGLVRLRTGTMRLAWKDTDLVVGQDALFFAPNSPTSFASLITPALSYSGDLWAWTPQMRVEHRIAASNNSTVTLQGGILDNLTGEPLLRNTLVVGQFAISIGLIVCTLVIYRQLHYMRTREVGFDRTQVLVLHNTGMLGDQGIRTFDKQLLTMAGVQDVTATGDLPTVGNDDYNTEGWFRDASMDAKRVIIMTTLNVDDHYIPTLGMKMDKGRNFDFARFPTDTSAVVINETCAQMLGLKEPLNQQLYRPTENLKSSIAYHIIGVVKDFNYNSMREKIHPLIMQLNTYNYNSVAIRFRTHDVYDLVREVESRYHGIKQAVPFSYTFMDADFDKLYHKDQQTGQIYITFSVFAILIACLGLFGLVTYAAEQRMKEIGIRKVLGARVGGIVGLLSKDFARLVGLAALIGLPVAGWFMYSWLNGFVYRTSLAWWIFIAAALTALGIALLTVSIQTIRAAVANPIRSLRSE